MTVLTSQDMERITMMRRAGVAYARIAKHLDLNANSVKTYCLRNAITVDANAEQVADPLGVWCLKCCTRIGLRRGSKFCSEQCRRAWWRTHRTVRVEELTCTGCGRQVAVPCTSGRSRKYCSHPCFIKHRFGTRGGTR